jgi:hypothetical protein
MINCYQKSSGKFEAKTEQNFVRVKNRADFSGELHQILKQESAITERVARFELLPE